MRLIVLRPTRRALPVLLLLSAVLAGLVPAVLHGGQPAGASGIAPGLCSAPQTVAVPSYNSTTQVLEKYVMAPRLLKLVDLVRQNGHTLTVNSGYRTCAQQVALRRQNCGTSDYAIYEMPAGQCSPATAIPGRSNHNYGMAADLACDGLLIAGNPGCLDLVRRLAPQAQLVNFTPEPWHWGVSDENDPASHYANDHAPTGVVDQITTSAGSIRVQGWLADRDSAGPVQDWLVVDGTIVWVGATNGYRPDVQAAGLSPGTRTGFDISYPLGAGQHTVCIRSQGDQPNRPPIDVACQATTVRYEIGSLDTADPVVGGLHVRGWGYDPQQPGATSTVAFRVDGVPVTSTVADGSRPDAGGGGNHGFDTVIKPGGGMHILCAVAVNSPSGFADGVLGCRTVSLPAPYGALDTVTSTVLGLQVTGWARDPDTTGPVTVHVVVDGTAHDVLAATARPDVGVHGYSTVVPVGLGSHTVCVTVDDVPTFSFATALGCRTASWPPPLTVTRGDLPTPTTHLGRGSR